MKKLLRNSSALGIAILICILLIGLCTVIWVLGGAKFRQAFSYSKRICNNLIEAGYLRNETDCIVSSFAPDVMAHYFPLGTTELERIQAGFQGFRQTTYSTFVSDGRMKDCPLGSSVIYVEYAIVILPPDEVYSFRLCDNKLVNMYWGN